jgi:AraC-like DNA-binding protein
MLKSIPTYDIDKLSGQTAPRPDIFFVDDQFSHKNKLKSIPYRSNYFGAGICVNGKATLSADLETYSIEKDNAITLSPQVVKQWINSSADYQLIAVFFTKEFFIENNSNKDYLDSFPFFATNSRHVFKVDSKQTETIQILLRTIIDKLSSSHPYKHEIARSLITALLFEISAIFNQQASPAFHKQTRSEQQVFEFKKLVSQYFLKERSVQFYADLLFVTPKHLTEVIKAVTGRSAKEWIDDTVILEAKILLKENDLTVSDISSILNFADQSTFGKFFKNLTGLSPSAYKQGE